MPVREDARLVLLCARGRLASCCICISSATSPPHEPPACTTGVFELVQDRPLVSLLQSEDDNGFPVRKSCRQYRRPTHLLSRCTRDCTMWTAALAHTGTSLNNPELDCFFLPSSASDGGHMVRWQSMLLEDPPLWSTISSHQNGGRLPKQNTPLKFNL